MSIYLITSNARPTPIQEQQLQKLGTLISVNAQKLSSKQVIEKISDVEILIAGPSSIEKIDDELLGGLKRLKFISLLTVGTNWVDLDAAHKRNVVISNIKGANSESVAEHTWGMILDLAKRITEFDRDVRQKGAFDFGLYRGKEVYGKTLGIIGLGDIGKKVARIAKGFGMKILGVNKSGKSTDGIEITSFKTLLKDSDVIAVCAPLTPETENLIGEHEIALMKKGVILVNCARHQVTNKEAVLKAVTSGKIFGFGIETEIMQPIPADDEYLKHPRIIVTPHNAFNTEDAEIKSFDLVIDNIKAFQQGKPQNVVT